MEASLAIQLSDLAGEVGLSLGFGATPASWTGWQPTNPYVASSEDTNLGWILRAIKKGLRQFYTPPVLPNMPVAHEWSFLSQLRTLTVQAGVQTYAMPDDYAGIASGGEFSFQPSDSTWCRVTRTSLDRVLHALQTQFTVREKPRLAALYVGSLAGMTGSRWLATFAPVPDATYTLSYISRLQPQALTNQNPYPLGGAVHGETILASCLAAAEEFFDNEQSTRRAVWMERLAASVSQDIQENAASTLGYNSDRSDGRDQAGFGLWPWGNNEPTYNNVPFSSL